LYPVLYRSGGGIVQYSFAKESVDCSIAFKLG